MKQILPKFFPLMLLVLIQTSCSKETEILETETIDDYYPLAVGKYITYQLDSTVYVALNTVKVVHRYIVQDQIESEFTDNAGYTNYRIRRRIRSNADTTRWEDNATFIVTRRGKAIEFVENNLRYIKLNEPFRDNFAWRGNSYINAFSNPDLQYLDNWEYFYEGVNQPFSAGGLVLPQTVTVNQRDEVLNDPGDKRFYFEINKSKEVYALGIGLVYREFLHEAWQPPNITSPSGYYEPNSYGVTLTLLNHNF